MSITEFENIYHRCFNTLCNKAHRMVNDSDAAKDIVQNVFLRFWTMKDILLITTTADAYLYKAVINETLNHLDKKERTSILQNDHKILCISTDPTVEDTIYFDELHQNVTNLLAQLPPKCRSAFMLSRFEHMSYKEIAKFMAISENTVDNHIKKALQFLRKSLLIHILTLYSFLL